MTMARVVSTSAGLAELRRRLDDLSRDGQAGVDDVLHAAAVTAGTDLRAALPADLAGSVQVEADGNGYAVTIAAPGARDLEFGTSRRPASPALRPVAAAAAERARTLLRGALCAALAKDRP